MEEKKNTKELTAPDGGWGWFVVFGYALNNMVILPMVIVFGLLYRDVLINELGMSTVKISAIIAINCSFGMMLAIFDGPILRKFGFRKVAIAGALITFTGNLLTSQASSFWEFVLYFGIFVSIGMNFVMAAFSLALNTYFVQKRGVATGVAMSLTGLGPIFMPLLVSFLISCYDQRRAGLILAALTLHSLVGAVLLQPVKWHRKKIEDVEIQKINPPKQPEMNGSAGTEKRDDTKEDGEVTAVTKLMENNYDGEIGLKLNSQRENSLPSPLSTDNVDKRKRTTCEQLVKFFDLDLLKDPAYVNISIGLSLAFISERNFSLMKPFILSDFGFANIEVAILMSALAGADILSRFTSPFLDKSALSRVRTVYMCSLLSSILCRILLIGSRGFLSTLVIIIALGITNGIRTVYGTLVIPTYVPLHKLASATGLQTFNNGVFFIIFAPLMGLIRDNSKNYHVWLHVINCFPFCTFLMWFTELYVLRKRKKPKKPIVINKG